MWQQSSLCDTITVHSTLYMIRTLSDLEIRELLTKQCYGHLGCHTNTDGMYVVPITYVYANNAIYGFAFNGKKIQMLRSNAEACFQVEKRINDTKWESAIIWGTFEELKDADRMQGLTTILERFWAEAVHDNPLYMPFRNSALALEKAKDVDTVIIYKITITKQTGRMEVYE